MSKTDRPIVHILIFPPLQGTDSKKIWNRPCAPNHTQAAKSIESGTSATKHLAGGVKHRDKRKAPIAGGLTFGWCGI